MTLRTFLALLLVFALSVALRVPNLGRPLGAHHEFCTALTLIILQNWHTDGIATHHGAPAINYPGPANAHIPWMTMGEAQRDGRSYYLSHPPLAYYLPYGMFALLSHAPSALGLELFALFFHFTSMLCVFLLLQAVVRERPELRWAPFGAAVLYAFQPSTLWFHSNAYMADIFVAPVWAIHLLAAYRCMAGGRPVMARHWWAYGLTLAATVFTSWLGVWAAVASAALLLFSPHPAPFRIRGLIITCAAVAIPMLLTFWIYSSVVGVDAYLSYLQGRSGFRSTLRAGELGLWPHIVQVLENYRMAALPALLLLVGALVLLFRRPASRSLPPLGTFLMLTVLPVLLELLFFLEYAGHDLVALKGCIVLCGLAALNLEAMLARTAYAGRWRTLILAGTSVVGALYYVRQNPYPGEQAEGPGSAIFLGREAADRVAADEVLFTFGTAWEPQVVWYVGRTPMRIRSVEEGAAFLQRYGHGAGILYRSDDSGGTWERITPDGRIQGLPERNR
jgi:hypothetical protein